MRDEFPARVKRILAERVGNRCSRPDCGALTSGPQLDESKALNVGVAAHITAASRGGPRFDPSLSAATRSSALNAIWLCQNCAKLIDNDPARYPSDVLREWKSLREQEAQRTVALAAKPVRTRRFSRAAPLLDIQVQEATLIAAAAHDPASVIWSVWIQIYATPRVRTDIDIPFHQVAVRLHVADDEGSSLKFADTTRLSPKGQPEKVELVRIFATMSELTVRGPGRVELYASATTRDTLHRPNAQPKLTVSADLRPVHAKMSSSLSVDLLRADDDGGFEYGRWVYPSTRVQESTSFIGLELAPESMESPFADLPMESPFADLPRPKGW